MAKQKRVKLRLPRITYLLAFFLLFITFLFVLHLGGLTHHKISLAEKSTASTIVGFHGIYHQPLYLPIKLVRSAIFNIGSVNNVFWLRLASVIFGLATVITFFYLVKLWHNARVAIMATVLFSLSAWTLHITRYASYDILYYWAIPTIFVLNTLFQKYPKNKYIWYSTIILFALILYIPGMVWFIAVDTYLIWPTLIKQIKTLDVKEKGYSSALGLVLIVLLLVDLFRKGQAKLWTGLPSKLPGFNEILKNFVRVPYHLFIRAPYNPPLWLGKLPILDVFSIVTCLAGIYYYIKHFNSLRSQLVGFFGIIGWILLSLGGAYSLSGLVVILYLLSASGIAYLLKEWFEVFPSNPIARSTGVVLLSIVIALAVFYNTRSYFVAWANNNATHSVFSYRD